jgi:hypothetical protein
VKEEIIFVENEVHCTYPVDTKTSETGNSQTEVRETHVSVPIQQKTSQGEVF